MEFRFGVRTADIGKAHIRVVEVTGFAAEALTHSDLGGAYFAYHGEEGEFGRLLSNRDVRDGEPVIDGCDEWPVVLFVEGASSDTPAIQNLLKDKEHFVLVSSR